MQSQTNIEFVFGGSFDPVHIGHISVISHLRQECPEWTIRLLPCSVPALKKATSASFEQRVDMLKLATEDVDYVVIDEREHHRQGKSYTLDSLQSLAKENVGRTSVLVVGADTVLTMDQWHRWQTLAHHCHLVLVKRPGSLIVDIEKVMQPLGFVCTKNIQELELTPYGRYYCLNIEEKDISSTEIRNRLTNKQTIDSLIPNCVNDYIKKNFIY